MMNVMKRAWEIYRTLVGDHRAKLAMALRMAWAEAKAFASEATGYAALEGTEKQVAWATKIRERFFRNYLERMPSEMVSKFYGIVNRKTSAKFWIEKIELAGVCDFEKAMFLCLAD